jgi:acetyl esterase/lipase
MLHTLVLLALAADVPAETPLYKGEAPGALGKGAADRPTLTAYLPPKSKATGAAVIICPGGGYSTLAMIHEGRDVAKWFADRGIAGFVLRYRHGPTYRHPIPLQDAQRAIRLVKSRAGEYGIDPARVGIMGFSAGGHLASCAATMHDKGDPDAEDPVNRLSSRPAYVVLAYPVITLMGPNTHAGSVRNLLGDKPDEKLLKQLSTHTRVTKDTPPSFLFHTKEDKPVPYLNSAIFHKACVEQGVPSKIVLKDKGAHGVGLGGKDAELSKWPTEMLDFLSEQKILRPMPK